MIHVIAIHPGSAKILQRCIQKQLSVKIILMLQSFPKIKLLIVLKYLNPWSTPRKPIILKDSIFFCTSYEEKKVDIQQKIRTLQQKFAEEPYQQSE